MIRLTEGFSLMLVILDCNYLPMTVAIYENYVYEGVGCIYGEIEETGFAISPALVTALCAWLLFCFFLFQLVLASYRPF